MMKPQTPWHWNRERRRRQLLRQMQNLAADNLMRGSLVTLVRRCGKRGCVCARSARKHPGRYLSVNLGGRTQLVYVRPEEELRVKAATGRYQWLWHLLDKLTEVNLELLRGRPLRRRRS